MAETKRSKLLDVAAIASLLGGIGGACLYLGAEHRSPTVRIPSDKFNPALYERDLEALLGGENDEQPMTHRATDPADFYDADEAETDASHDGPQSEQHERFGRHEPAELYGFSAVWAVPVVVDRQRCDQFEGDSESCDENDLVTYTVTDMNGETMRVEEEFLHRYERYQEGTKALCVEKVNVRGKDPDVVPCLVKSSNVEKSRGVDYPVYYVVRFDADTGELVYEYLPFQNVQRLVKESALDGSHVLELLEDALSLEVKTCWKYSTTPCFST